MFATLIPLLASLAPTIVKAIGTPLQEKAISSLASALDLSDSSVDTIKTALNTLSPQGEIAVKKADYDFYIQNGAQLVESLKALASVNASKWSINDPLNKLRSQYMYITAILVVLCVGGAVYLFAKGEVTGGEGALLGSIITAIIMPWRGIGDFLCDSGVTKAFDFFKNNKDD